MYIAICDDDAQEMKSLVSIIREYAAGDESIRIQTFGNAEGMLKTAAEERFTHYFLDVMMPGMDGIRAARELRGFDTDAKIVFLTSFKEFAYQSYRVRAYDYLLKPAGRAELFELLERMQAEEAKQGECISIRGGRSVFRIPFARLSYLEVFQKKLHFHMTDGQVRQIAGTLAEVEKKLLLRPEFAKIHRSYIVNMNRVSEISPEGCVMFSGDNLPISRLLFKQVREDYMAHLFDGAEG